MTATNHVLTGAVIATMVHNPAVAIPAAFLSHFCLDALPHFGLNNHVMKQFYVILSIDATTASLLLSTILVLQPAYWWLLILCGIAAASPDLMWLPRFIKEVKLGTVLHEPWGPIASFHSKIQWAGNLQLPGVIIELAWFGSMLALLAPKLRG